MTKMENKSNILQRLNAESNDNYEKVASRMRLAMKIADAIEASGMTKKEFAARLGKHPSEISKWLSGTHNFTHDTLFEISKVLDIDLIDTNTELSMASIVCDNYDIISMKRVLSGRSIMKRISLKDSSWESNPETNTQVTFAFA